jgi:transposase InsO family protein
MQLTRSATIPCTRSRDEHLCHACQLGRHVRLPFSSSSSHATHAFDLVHCDLWTSPITSMSDYKYYLVVLDDFSHYVWTFPLHAKSEAFPALRHFFAWVSTQFGLTIKAVQCDNGREFDNSTSRDFFLSHGMQLHMSCPYISSQNGKAERMIRTTNDTIRTLLLQAHLPARFWAKGLHTSTYLLNRLPSTACPAPTPHQTLFGTPPRYDHLRVFGCACYPNTAATAPHKLAPRSTLCVFLGYSPDHKGYRCFDLSSRRVLISRHVVFDEFVFPFTTTPPSSDPDLDLFTLFPTDVVVEPPILPLSAGTRSLPVGPTPGPVPCPGPVVSPTVVSPLRGAPSSITPGPSGGGGPVPPAGPSVPTPPARFAQPVRVYQHQPPRCPRRRPQDRHRRSLQHASPSRCASTSAGCRRRGSHLHRRRPHR